MSNPAPPSNGEPSPQIEKLLDAANSSSQTVAALHVAFMAFAAYLGVIIWGTTHEDLLRISPVKLPILDVELPLTTFYGSVPWLLVLLHFNLLMQLELLSRKLWNLDKELPDTAAGQQVRDRLFIFPFTHLIAGRSGVRLIRWLLSLVVGLTVIAMPLVMLLAAQIRFLPYHDEVITWWQRGAVWTDAAMLLALWPLIASPNDQAWEWWCHLRFRLFGFLAYPWCWAIRGWNRLRRLIQNFRPKLDLREIAQPRSMPQTGAEGKGAIILLASMCVVLPLSIVAVIPGSITVETYYQPPEDSPEDMPYFEDWLIRNVPATWLSVAAVQHVFFPGCASLAPVQSKEPTYLKQHLMLSVACKWFDLGLFPRNLDLPEARLLPKGVSISLLTRAIDSDKLVREAAFKEFEGLDLKGRDLRFANLFGAAIPNADLRGVKLQGADLSEAKLQGADLSIAELQGANLNNAQLQGADLHSAHLQGARLDGTMLRGVVNLNIAELQGAELSNADLQGENLSIARLQGADLSFAKLQGANLYSAKLQGAILSYAMLQGANLIYAKLQGADLSRAELQGAGLDDANLQGADLSYANLQGANLIRAQLQGADLSHAELQGANLSNAQLQGIDWLQAHLDDIFIANNSKSDWNEQRQRAIETALKPLLKDDSFAEFQLRMDRASKRMPPGEPVSQAGCYSDNPKLLECGYHQKEQLSAYLNDSLYPKLIDLACSDAAIAEGIAFRGYRQYYESDDPDFHLTAALLKALDSQNPCRGLAALSEQTRQRLREAAEKQKNAEEQNAVKRK